jgi:ABC-type amino acid transport system permease subunit
VARRPAPPWWRFSARELRTHAFLYAVCAWAFAAYLLLGGQGARTVAGVLKFQDFVYFYTLGHLASDGDWQALSRYPELHAVQTQLVPEAEKLIYPPVYPPYTALYFAPFAKLPYLPAAAIWGLLTAVGYAAIVYVVWRAGAPTVGHGSLIAAAALAYPPFWQLVMNGQFTIVVLGAFTLGWLLLEREHRFLAGAAFGLLASKPQLAVPLTAVVVFRREWQMMLGAICAIALQAAFVAWRLDVTALFEFVRGVPQMLAQTEILEAKPWAGHSLRTLTRLLPGWVGTPLWVLLAGLCIAAAIRTWRPSIPLRVRLGVIVLVSVLASPHLLVYDATILVLPLLWFAEWMETRARYTVRYRVLAHALIVAFALPVARVIGLQPSVVVMCWMCAVVCRAAWEADSNPPAWLQ